MKKGEIILPLSKSRGNPTRAPPSLPAGGVRLQTQFEMAMADSDARPCEACPAAWSQTRDQVSVLMHFSLRERTLSMTGKRKIL